MEPATVCRYRLIIMQSQILNFNQIFKTPRHCYTSSTTSAERITNAEGRQSEGHVPRCLAGHIGLFALRRGGLRKSSQRGRILAAPKLPGSRPEVEILHSAASSRLRMPLASQLRGCWWTGCRQNSQKKRGTVHSITIAESARNLSVAPFGAHQTSFGTTGAPPRFKRVCFCDTGANQTGSRRRCRWLISLRRARPSLLRAGGRWSRRWLTG